MFALVAVGAAGVVDGFAAGLYIGHRFLSRKVKDVVVETEEKAAEKVQHVADKVKETVAPVAVKPPANEFYKYHDPSPIPGYNKEGEVVPIPAPGLLEQSKRFRAGDAFLVGQERTEKPGH